MTLSLLVNVGVLLPVCIGLFADADWAQASFGQASPARSILLSVYLAIGAVSAMLLVFRDPKLVAALLLVQVIYKLSTPLTVGTLGNPVVVSNLLIAALHTVTLVVIWRSVS
ncbi:MAG: hypothetical protein AAFN78_06175 [Pseudomonadota bacterium]